MDKTEKIEKQLCAIYTRVSSDEQITSDFSSLDSQREYAENYIKSQGSLGWEISPEIYTDPGYSGGNMDRPGLQKLLADIKKGKFQILVIYKIDRLTRNLRDFGKLWDMFVKHNVSFVSVTQKFDTTTSMGRLMLHILLSFAQFEREINSERTSDKRLASAKKGKWLGGFPIIGFDVDHERKKLLINEKEREQVNFMFHTYLKEKALSKATKAINEKGYRTKAWTTLKGRHMGGKIFTLDAVRYYLQNTLYIGKIKHKGILYDGEHDSIIDDEIFNRVQNLLKSNRVTRNSPYGNKPNNYLLTGLINCTYCGSKMTPYTCRSKGRKYSYYKCTRVIKTGKESCKFRTLPAREIENMIIERIKYLSNSPELLKKIIDRTCASTNSEVAELMDKQASNMKIKSEMETDIEDLKRYMKNKIKNDKEMGFLAEDRAELVQKHSELLQEIESTKYSIEKTKDRIVDADIMKNNFKYFGKIFNELVYKEKKDLLNLIIREIRFNGEQSQIEIDLYQLPDIGLNIKNDTVYVSIEPRLPETFSDRTTPLSSTDCLIPPSETPLFWLTDAFSYSSVKTNNGGRKMITKWGYPSVNLKDTDLTLGVRIKALRIKNGLKQAVLAESAGIGTSVLARYEQGKILDLTPHILQKIAKVLTIEPLELLPVPNHPSNREFLDYFCPSDSRGSRIRKLRLSRNLQQNELARLAGVTKATVCRYEKDQLKPSEQVILRINEILKAPSESFHQ